MTRIQSCAVVALALLPIARSRADAPEAGTARWYWTDDELPRIAAFIRDEMPEAYKAAIDEADIVMDHRFPHSCSPTVVKYVQLTPEFGFMDNPTGDRQFLYTLHRHLFWQQLAIAYALTRDERYATEWAKQARRWLDQCPTSITDPEVRKHEMWYGLDAGIRAYRWAWADRAFRQSPAFTPDLRDRLHQHWAEHARFLRQYHAAVNSNWCTMQMYGLFTAALYCEKLDNRAELRDYAARTLVQAIRAQVRPDGVQVEQSPSYHVGCIAWFTEPMRLAELNGITFPDDYRERIEKMCDFARWIIAPDGLLPALSDTDRSPEGRYALVNGAVLFNRPEFAARAELTARHVFVFGADAIRAFPSLGHPSRIASASEAAQTTEPREPASRPSLEAGSLGFARDDLVRHFPDAGYVVMRSGWDPNAAFTVFDCGPRGHWHGHFDLLNIEIQAFGKLLIADPGRWWYDDSPLRRELIGIPAHNTVSLDGLNHASLEENPNREYEMVAVDTRDGWTHIHARHRAYTDMKGPPLIERHLFHDGRCTWIILDRVEAPEPHDVLANYQFAQEPVRRISPTAVVSGQAGQPGVVLVHEADAAWQAALEPSTISPVYGQKQPATRLGFRARGSQVQLVTALRAFVGPDVPEAAISLVPGNKVRVKLQVDGGATSLQLNQGGEWSLQP